MKYIHKRVPPDIFQDWLNMAHQDWKPTYANLQNPEKSALHESLLFEQGWICCYCGRSITKLTSHIEHFRPQSRNEDLDLNYENLLASCGREFEPGAPSHCGHSKKNMFEEDLHISPLDENCEERFLYAFDGQIFPRDLADVEASYMRELLQLDINFLRNRREEAIRRVFDEDFLLTALPDELQKISQKFRELDEEGKAPDFGHAVARFAEQQIAAN